MEDHILIDDIVLQFHPLIVEAEADLKAATSNPSLVGNECVTGR